ncbi:hypothetical protein MMC20_005159 [Loxospora ochrophaea]|nr:hypothetical protein [Loxospora ochrophaea]
MLGMLVFLFFRFFEIVTLIPALGMLAYFVHIYASANQLTPNFVLVLFIVTVLATVWAIITALRRNSTRRSALFVAFIDLCFVGALIAGVYELRFIAKANCTNFTTTTVGASGDGFGIYGTVPTANTNKQCAMLKASFAFGIMNILFFFMTSILALFLHRHEKEVVVKETVTSRRRSHDSR